MRVVLIFDKGSFVGVQKIVRYFQNDSQQVTVLIEKARLKADQ